jgi:hypothetical protein
MFSLSIDMPFLPATKIGEFSVYIRNDVLEGRHTTSTVPCSFTGCLLLSKFPQDGTVRLKLGNSNLRSRFNRRCMSREQGEEETNSVPNLDSEGLIDANELPWSGVGMDDG